MVALAVVVLNGELESWLSASLIVRSRPRLSVTEEGRRVAEAVRAGTEAMVGPLKEIRRRVLRASQVTLAATNAFALYWLSPRMHGFYAAHPDIELNLTTTDREISMDRRDFDLGIVFSARPLPGAQTHLLFGDEIIAVSSPAYGKTRPETLEPGQWERETLLHVEQLEESWIGWREWFQKARLPAPKAARVERFSSYMALLRAALAGRGIAMGWRRLVDPLIARGQLVRLGSRCVTPSGVYRLISRPTPASRRPYGVAALHDWLVQEADACARNAANKSARATETQPTGLRNSRPPT